MTELGRLPDAEAAMKIIADAPEKQVAAMLTQQDKLIDAIKALCAKLDAEGSIDTDYSATISDGLSKIQLYL